MQTGDAPRYARRNAAPVPVTQAVEPEYPGLLASLVLVFVVKEVVGLVGMLCVQAITGWQAYYCWPIVKCCTYLMLAQICYALQPAKGAIRYFALQRVPWQAAVRVPILYFGAMILFIGFLGLSLQGLALVGLTPDQLSGPREYKDEPWVMDFLSSVVVAPLTEELLMRGIVLQGLLQRYSALPAVVLSAAIFGLFHGNAQQAISGFITGCVLGYVFVQTRSLWVTILMHASHNAFATLLAALPLVSDTPTTVPSKYPVIPFSRPGWFTDLALVGLFILVHIGVGWLLFHFSYRELKRQLAQSRSAVAVGPADVLATTLPLTDFKARRRAPRSESG